MFWPPNPLVKLGCFNYLLVTYFLYFFGTFLIVFVAIIFPYAVRVCVLLLLQGTRARSPASW